MSKSIEQAKDEATARHTPGPWLAGQDGNNRVYGPDNAGEDSGLIAVVYKGRSNINLIAAAPDLLAALKDMVALHIKRSPHALHPSKLFCKHCGRNSEQRLHVEGCQVETAELAIAAAERREGE